MNALHRLEISIKDHLSPILRADGFTGSGRTFRRVTGDFVQVLNVQGSQTGGQFAINLGIQPLRIPDVRGEKTDPKKITEVLCEFRRRLSESGADQWWKYGATQESMNDAMSAAAAVYRSKGREILEGFESPASPFHIVTAESFKNGDYDLHGFGSTEVCMALALARFKKAQGLSDQAIKFAHIGLASVGNASLLRAELQGIVASVE